MPADNQEDELLVKLVEEALGRIDKGETLNTAEICRDRPELIVALDEVLEMSGALPSLQADAAHVDRLAGELLCDRYRLQDCIGRGAMGMVYFAQDLELNRAVAVKILDERLFYDPSAKQRFTREARALATVQHPNVVSVYDRGETPEGIHYLVMERLQGASLSELAQSIADQGSSDAALAGVLEEVSDEAWPRRCARWARLLADGLQLAHEAGLVHRDIKPSNVFLTTKDRVVLLDFGIVSADDQEALTATDTAIGTPAYMAPEQTDPAWGRVATPALDIYGLGATFYDLLTGCQPYSGQPAQILAQQQSHDPKPILERAPDLPRDLAAIVERCMDRDPARRYLTARALADDLAAFLDHLPVAARPIRPWQRRLRRWRRAPARPLAVLGLVCALVTLWWSLPVFFDLRNRDIEADKAEEYRRLPALLAIDGWPNERVLASVKDENEAAIQQLDRILALDPGDLPLRLWRACLLLDLGRREEAASEFSRLAGGRDTPYLSALAARYAAGDPDRVGAESIDLSDLPEPVDARELYIAGFHELRNRHITGYAGRAYKLLTAASDEYVPARDLRLLALANLVEKSPRSERKALNTQLYDETVALEELYQGPTARTLFMRGVALLLRNRDSDTADAIEAFQQALVLRPDRHGPHQNLGVAYKRVGDLEASERHLAKAIALHPFAWNTRYTMAQVLRLRRKFTEALAMLDKLPTEGPFGSEAVKIARLRGLVFMALANKYEGVEPDKAKRAAQSAAESFRLEMDLHTSDYARQRARQQLAVVDAFLVAEPNERVTTILKALVSDPLQPHSLASLAHRLSGPVELGPREALYLSWLMRVLAMEQAPDDERFQARMQREIEDLQAALRRLR